MSATCARTTGLGRNHASPPHRGATSAVRRIVLHADDFGMNAAVTDGILDGFDEGLLTSTSLMSNAPDAARALNGWQPLESRRREGELKSAARRRRLTDPAQPFDLGVHLNLTQGRPMIGHRFPAELLDGNGRFLGVFGLFRRLLRCQRSTLERIEEELTCQVQFMVDHAHQPTHLNGHQYIELLPPIGRIVESLLERFAIPAVRVAWEPSWRKAFAWPGVRATQWLLGGVKKHYAGRWRRRMIEQNKHFAEAFFGTMTAGTTTAAMLGAVLAATRGNRLVEVGVHPAMKSFDKPSGVTDGWHDPLAAFRPRELAMIVSTDLEERLMAENCGLGRLAAM